MSDALQAIVTHKNKGAWTSHRCCCLQDQEAIVTDSDQVGVGCASRCRVLPQARLSMWSQRSSNELGLGAHVA
jgi:hypothetical protein